MEYCNVQDSTDMSFPHLLLRIPSLRGFVILLGGQNDVSGGVMSRVTIRNLAVTIQKVSNVSLPL